MAWTQIEQLERRSMMSATVTGGVLNVRGTAGADHIHIYEVVDVSTGQPVSSVVSGDGTDARPPIPVAGIRRIVVRAGAGDDVIDLNLETFTVDSQNGRGVTVQSRLDGGPGDDRLIGGSAADRVFGGAGTDLLDGNAGVDRLLGGSGSDVFLTTDTVGERVDFRARRGDVLRVPTAETGPIFDPLLIGPLFKTFVAGDAFTFAGPSDLAAVPVQGIDSFVGQYSSPSYEIHFDYGRYSGFPGSDATDVRPVTVDGRSAKIATVPGGVAIFFPEVANADALSLSVILKEGSDRQVAETILSSIDFTAAI